MHKLTTNLQRVAVYMDDILVIGATAAENLQNLHAILKTSLLLGEVLLAQLSIEHLGHSLSQHRVGKGHKVNVPSLLLFFGGVLTVLQQVSSKSGYNHSALHMEFLGPGKQNKLQPSKS